MTSRRMWGLGTVLAAIVTISPRGAAQSPSQTIPAPNTRAARRTLNLENCRLDFAFVNDVPLRVYVPLAKRDSTAAAGVATSVIPAGDTTGANCFVTTFFATQPAAYYFQPQPVVMTVTPPANPATPIGFVPRKIIMSSTSGGEVALPFKPTPDSGVIRQVKRPPR